MDGATEAITKAGEHSADNWVRQNLTSTDRRELMGKWRKCMLRELQVSSSSSMCSYIDVCDCIIEKGKWLSYKAEGT
jgi:hypothetical protein